MQAKEQHVHAALVRLNQELSERGDRARIRFASIEPDPDFEGEWLVLVTWELPDPDAADKAWPLEELDRYCELVADRLEDVAPATECLFRTSRELRDDAKLGTAVPERV